MKSVSGGLSIIVENYKNEGKIVYKIDPIKHF